MGGRIAVIFMAVVLGGIAGAAAVLFLSRDVGKGEQRVEGRTLREWSLWLDATQDKARRETAWRVLPQFPPEQVAGVLVELLDGKETAASQQAIAELVKLGAKGEPALQNALVSGKGSAMQRSHAIEVLRQLGQASAPAVHAIARQIGDPVAGGVALNYFKQHGVSHSAVSEAIRVLESLDGFDTTRRRNVVELLTLSATQEGVAGVLAREVTRPRDAVAQGTAFEALCGLCIAGGEAPPPVVVEAIASRLGDPIYQRGARRALLMLGAPAAPALEKLAVEKELRRRGAAVEVLLALPESDAAVEKALRAFRDDVDADLRRRVLTALNEPPATRPMMPLLDVTITPATTQPAGGERIALFQPSDGTEVDQWMIGGAAAEEEPVPPLPVALAPLPPIRARENEWDSDEKVLSALKVFDAKERQRLVHRLPYCRDTQAAMNIMIAAMDDPDLDVRRAAVSSLGRSIHSRRAVDRLIEALRYDGLATIRRDAARALAPKVNWPSVSDALAEAEDDADANVAEVARQVRRSGAAP